MEKSASAAKLKRGKKAAPPEPEQADELATAGVADEELALEDSDSVAGGESESAEEDEGTSAKKPKKQAILKAPTGKQKPGKVG